MMIRCHASTLWWVEQSLYLFDRGKILSARKLPPNTDGVSENRTHDNHCNSFKFSYFLDSMWSPLFRFFSFVDRVSSHYFCRHPPSQQEVGKLQERKQFLKKKQQNSQSPTPLSLLVYRCSQKFVASFAILPNYKNPQGRKRYLNYLL